jgi:hypothetical protein
MISHAGTPTDYLLNRRLIATNRQEPRFAATRPLDGDYRVTVRPPGHDWCGGRLRAGQRKHGLAAVTRHDICPEIPAAAT